MGKIRLEIDTLEVVSFVTAEAAESRGTVLGQGRAFGTGPVDSCDGTCYQAECNALAAAGRAVSGVSCIAYSCVGYCEPQTSLEPMDPNPEPRDTLIC